jgi:hypothetical protein
MDAESDPTVMVPLFGCFQMIATNYAHAFADFYKDVLDIVCGWRTDVADYPKRICHIASSEGNNFAMQTFPWHFG